MDKEDKRIAICSILIILAGALIMAGLIILGWNKVYEYKCDHIPITEAWKDQRCKDYFYRKIGE